MKILLLSMLPLIGCATEPRVSLGSYFFIGAKDETLAQVENTAIITVTQKIILAIAKHDTERLLELVHKKEGAIIDAKEIVPFDRVRAALENPNSMLYRTLWDDHYWQKSSPSENIHSYQKVFMRAGEIRTDIYYYSTVQCELDLKFSGRPSMGIMGNPILKKRDGLWYLVKFF